MFDIYTKNGWLPITNQKNYNIVYEYNGDQILTFDISTGDELYTYIANEVQIKNEENKYLIKDINKRKSLSTITCKLDMDAWRQLEPYLTTKEKPEFQTKTLSKILEYIKPPGWTIINAGIRDIQRTIELENASNYDVLMNCQKVFEVVYRIDNLNKTILIIDPEQVVDKGIYITPQLNLQEMTMTGSSDSFVTRISAYGKKNENGSYVNFAAINGGKTYIENNTYAKKANPVWVTWKDERYLDPQSLLSATKEKLKTQSFPMLSFEVTVNDLAEFDDRYSFLKMMLYDIAHVIIDEKISVVEKVIKYQRFPDNPEKNKITLSSEPQTITGQINDALSVLGDGGSKLTESFIQEAQKAATELINAFATKGYKYETENEVYFLDALPKEKAVNVMRQNLGGIGFSRTGWKGPYTTAWTIDGRFNADFITAGTLRAIALEAVNITGGTINGSAINGNQIIGNVINGNQIIGNDIIGGTISGTVVQSLQNGKKAIELKSSNVNFYDWGGSQRFVGSISTGANLGNSAPGITMSTFQGFINLGAFTDTSHEYTSTSLIMDMGNITGYAPKPITVYDEISFENGVYLKHRDMMYSNGSYMAIMAKGAFLICSSKNSATVEINNNNTAVYGHLQVEGSFYVNGTKTRIVDTKTFGTRGLNAVESADSVFEDFGGGELGENGICVIELDQIFLETVNTDCAYYVQLTKLADGNIHCSDKEKEFFIVKGTPGIAFDWRITAKQKGYEFERLNRFNDKQEQTPQVEISHDILLEDELKNVNERKRMAESFYERYIDKMLEVDEWSQ